VLLEIEEDSDVRNRAQALSVAKANLDPTFTATEPNIAKYLAVSTQPLVLRTLKTRIISPP
jgi:hypothetical protein